MELIGLIISLIIFASQIDEIEAECLKFELVYNVTCRGVSFGEDNTLIGVGVATCWKWNLNQQDPILLYNDTDGPTSVVYVPSKQVFILGMSQQLAILTNDSSSLLVIWSDFNDGRFVTMDKMSFSETNGDILFITSSEATGSNAYLSTFNLSLTEPYGATHVRTIALSGKTYDGSAPPMAYSPYSNIVMSSTSTAIMNFVNVSDGNLTSISLSDVSLDFTDCSLVTIGQEHFFAIADSTSNLHLIDIYPPFAERLTIPNFGQVFATTQDNTTWWSASCGLAFVSSWKVNGSQPGDIFKLKNVPIDPTTSLPREMIIDPNSDLPVFYSSEFGLFNMVRRYSIWEDGKDDMSKCQEVSTSVSGGVSTSVSVQVESLDFVGSSKKEDSIVGIVVGTVLGILFFLGILGTTFFVLWRRSRRDPKQNIPSVELSLNDSKSYDHWHIPYRDLTLKECLGSGSFGIVYMAEWRSAPCVVKQMKASTSASLASDAIFNFMQEMNSMRKLRTHPNVCKLLGVCVDDDSPLCIVTEHMSEGSLWDFLVNGRSDVTAGLVLSFATDAARGMTHLHSEDFMHCDLAARNLLVAPGSNGYVVKVADFGLSKSVRNDACDLLEAPLPIRWTSPEVLSGNALSKANDVWAFGVTVWEICERKRPYFQITSNQEVGERVMSGDLRLSKPDGEHVASEVWDIAASCFQIAQDRPSFQKIYEALAALGSEQKIEESPKPTMGEYETMPRFQTSTYSLTAL
eukprot:TRINITY_DN5314_c0_g1_i1.p1 TRINITY_DN5314_c0_g1~~TRINITY_DN5314_c0_g1_i1.p1  ORF type:complete len:743 (+),score=196.98 TRINITY_DN5314_c0_g1_i1:1-2229(+)